MIYEMASVRCLPGQLPALLEAFRGDHAEEVGEHGTSGRVFTTLIGGSNQELTYFLAWESLAEREKKWNACRQRDPNWPTSASRSREDGQIVGNIVSQLLVPTAFSTVK